MDDMTWKFYLFVRSYPHPANIQSLIGSRGWRAYVTCVGGSPIDPKTFNKKIIKVEDLEADRVEAIS